MSRAFSTMKTNVGNNVMDTSPSFATILGTYINKRYFQILRAVNWNYYNEDYSFDTVAGTQDYAMPSDFSKEVYAVNSTDGVELARIELQDLASQYPDDLTTQGSVLRYVIFNSDDGNKYMRLHYIPSSIVTIKVPYKVKPVALTGNVENKLDIEDLIELGATADAWRYKRQFAKARDIESLFQKELNEYIFNNENTINKVPQFIPATFDRDTLY